MARTILKARYSLTPTTDPDLVEIGILPKDLFRLTAKMTFWSMLPSVVIVAGLIVIGTYEQSKTKPSHTEDHLPQD